MTAPPESNLELDRPSANRPAVVYPESDGQPMAENTLQYLWITTLATAIQAAFADRDDVFVAADLLWYPIEGNNKNALAPDVMVAFGRPKGHRGSYLQWQENNLAPQVVIEVKSPSNTNPEMDEKRRWYEKFGALEYIQIDPQNSEVAIWQRPTAADDFVRVSKLHEWVSPHLGIRFIRDWHELRVVGPDDQILVAPHEWVLRANAEAKRANAEAKRAAAEAERAIAAERLAEDERQRAEAAEQRANAEKSARDRLAAKLRELGIDPDTLDA